MTEREWRGEREVVLERDERTCRRCGTAATEDPNGLRLYPVGDVPRSGTVHESALVAVCTPCFASLRSEPDGSALPDDEALFSLVRETTERQGVTVSAVAAFASLATKLPGELAAATADSDPVSIPDTGYVRARREVLLAIDSVDSRLDHLYAIETDALDPNLADPLAEFAGTGTKLQSELRGIVALGECIAAGLGRCHGCFGELEADVDRCGTCDLERRDVADWRSADGSVDFEGLFDAINETLQAASGTTEALTDRTTSVAEQLRGG
ncbi:HNH endonuclease [Natrarchaeobius oligotrophus]|uniref:HNH endonuclease n=1 Tax=Natrarchaeobius chitinivorans TaxID=1679083 RepID=A0A3N6M914_NATCH|nr:HNH endonuclease [Natrarchaeobius chitinivorans]RQG98867.1 HNH endonuclease [Natrarchaeobius chitinivorans]